MNYRTDMRQRGKTSVTDRKKSEKTTSVVEKCTSKFKKTEMRSFKYQLCPTYAYSWLVGMGRKSVIGKGCCTDHL